MRQYNTLSQEALFFLLETIFHHQKIGIMASSTEEFFFFGDIIWIVPLFFVSGYFYFISEIHLCNCTFGNFYIVFHCVSTPTTRCINTSCMYVCSLWIVLFEEFLYMSSVKPSHLFLLGVYLLLCLGHCMHASSASVIASDFLKWISQPYKLYSYQHVMFSLFFILYSGTGHHCGFTSHLMIDVLFSKFLAQLNISCVDLYLFHWFAGISCMF